MTWNLDVDAVDDETIVGFTPDEVLYDFDGPRIFTLQDRFGQPLIASWCDETNEADRYIVVPTTRTIIQSLKKGTISVRDALDQPRCWVGDVFFLDGTFQLYRTSFDKIPSGCLPKPGTMLLPSLQPLLTLRAVGDAIAQGSIPGSVIRACVEGPQKAMKLLSELVLGLTPRPGKPDEVLRRLFDLPTQRLAFSSFEISFGLPELEFSLFTEEESQELDSVVKQVEQYLVSGLDWLTRDATELATLDDTSVDIILRALKELTPATSSKIEKIHLSGRLTGRRKSFVVSEASRKRINLELRNRKLEPKQEEFFGLIRELDKDRLAFDLRGSHIPSQRFAFEPDLLDDVLRALAEDLEVRVIARTFAYKNTAEALAIILPRE